MEEIGWVIWEIGQFVLMVWRGDMSHRKEICKIISEMLDNPDKSGIFQTTKAFDALEELINKAKVEAIGWMYAEACANADDGIDIRKIEVPSLIVRAKEDLIITK